jgi:hypothetical protein
LISSFLAATAAAAASLAFASALAFADGLMFGLFAALRSFSAFACSLLDLLWARVALARCVGP